MKSHLGWTAFSVIGALGLMTTALAVEAQTGQNLVINGDFESGNLGFTKSQLITRFWRLRKRQPWLYDGIRPRRCIRPGHVLHRTESLDRTGSLWRLVQLRRPYDGKWKHDDREW